MKSIARNIMTIFRKRSNLSSVNIETGHFLSCFFRGDFLECFHQYEEIIMVRISKQAEKRARFPRKHRSPSPKTGSLKDNLPSGYKPHANAAEGESAATIYIAKIK